MTSEKQARPNDSEEEEVGALNGEPKFKVPRKSPSKEAEDGDIHRKIQEAQARVKEKEETVRKLRLVKMYRTKWETQGLDTITQRWLTACQEALVDLRNKVHEMKSQESGEEELTLKMLIENLGLDSELLKLNDDEDCFIT